MSFARHVDRERLARQIDELAAFSDAPAPAVTRVVYTDTDRAAREWLLDLATAIGLEVRVDPIGNTFFRWAGAEPGLPAVGTGSHLDAIPHAGRYDGVVGVLGGLEAVRALAAGGFEPRRSIDVVLFTAEEPTRFGIGCFGSRTLVGNLTPTQLRELRDDSGEGLDEARERAGFTGDLADVALPHRAYASFVELHIEQGPHLERRGLDIGVVTAIAAPATLHVTVRGPGGHAGAVLMPDRRDALAAAAEMIGAVEESAREHGGADTVATVGRLDVHPGAVNSIPSRVFFTVDLRDIDGARRDRVLDRLRQRIAEIAHARGVAHDLAIVNADPPASCAQSVRDAIAAAADAVGATRDAFVSRAYHDALFMAHRFPTGMIFIPCRDGVSHRPDEYASPSAISTGTAVLAETLARLAA